MNDECSFCHREIKFGTSFKMDADFRKWHVWCYPNDKKPKNCTFCEKPILKDDKTMPVNLGSESHTWHKRCHHIAFEAGLIKDDLMEESH